MMDYSSYCCYITNQPKTWWHKATINHAFGLHGPRIQTGHSKVSLSLYTTSGTSPRETQELRMTW